MFLFSQGASSVCSAHARSVKFYDCRRQEMQVQAASAMVYSVLDSISQSINTVSSYSAMSCYFLLSCILLHLVLSACFCLLFILCCRSLF